MQHQSLDTLLIGLVKMLENCSPMDIVCLRGVCSSSRNIIDSNPFTWAAARRNTGNVPPPPNPDMPEWQWAVVVFTGPVRFTNMRVHLSVYSPITA